MVFLMSELYKQMSEDRVNISLELQVDSREEGLNIMHMIENLIERYNKKEFENK